MAWCALNSPWYISSSEAAVASRTFKENIIVHNEFGEKKCGWESAR